MTNNSGVYTFHIKGMTCATCLTHAREALQSLDGIVSVAIDNLRDGNARVESIPGAVTFAQIADALENVGYSAVMPSATYAVLPPDKRMRPTSKSPLTYLLIGFMIVGLAITAVMMTSGSAAPTVASQARLPSIVDAANAAGSPSLRLTSLDGSTVTVPDTSRRATIVLATTPGCGSCLPEIEALVRIGQEHGDTVRIVIADINPASTSELLQSLSDYIGPNNLTWAFDRSGDLFQTYSVRSLETTIIFDSSGREVYRDIYLTPYETLRDELAQVVSG